MHNLAIALCKKGYCVSGSDDEIFEPSRSRLQHYGLLPENEGWYPEKIDTTLDAVILGMHARIDNPELLKARELGLKIYSYPEYLYEQSKNKKRIVIAGSHGKTTITAMILHVLQYHKVHCDYMVGAQLDGFDVMVKLTDDAPYMIIEGDEYLTSPINRRPKFHLYKPHIAVVSGIAWDHINVFPTFENYVEQFKIFIKQIAADGHLVYYKDDETLHSICADMPLPKHVHPYTAPSFKVHNGTTYLKNAQQQEIPLQIFGKHNLSNLKAAMMVCRILGVDELAFMNAIRHFKGASKRLELVKKSPDGHFFKDFAHAPSKLKASIDALRNQYPKHLLIACIELHTFSSLNKNFLPLYNNTMTQADLACVYFNPATLAHKKLPEIDEALIKQSFGSKNIVVFNDSDKMKKYIMSKTTQRSQKINVIMMSSGNFDGLVYEEIADEIFN